MEITNGNATGTALESENGAMPSGGTVVLTGDAVVGNVLSGKKFYKDDAETQLTGTMANNVSSATVLTPSTSDQAFPAGYYGGAEGDGKVLGDADLTAANIKKSVDIFGVTGSYVTPITGDAVVGEVLSGKKFYKDNAETQLTGTMPNSSGNVLPSSAGTTIPAGYHDGTGKTTPDADLVEGNIKSGVVLFGITGTFKRPLASIGAITGTLSVGSTLTAGDIAPTGATATYQWQKSDTVGGTYNDIIGATNSTYVLVTADSAKYIRVSATGSGVYTGTVSSTPVLVESASTPFIATYNTALTAWWAPDNIHLALPLIDTGTYNMVVNWGDGSSDTITAYNQPAATHTYAAVGIYEVTITGVCNGWSYNQWGDGSKLTDVKQWGSDFRLGNTGNNFNGCGNMVITATDVLNMTGTTNLYAMFKDCAKLDRLPNFDTSLVTKMSYLLSGCTIFNASIAVLDTSSATDMKGMFRYCNAFNQPISTLDTSSAIDMSGMFEQCFVFNQPVSTLNLTGTINVYSMFENCYAFNQPVSSWDTSSATSFFGMFYNCGFFNRSLATFDVTKAVSLSSMLTGCANYSRANYDALLISWASQSDITGLKAGAYFGAGTVKYSAGAAAAARANIINTNSWTITDGGQF